MSDRLTRYFRDNPYAAFLAASYIYFLAIALLRESPYWPRGIALPTWGGVLLALLPLAPGLFLRKPGWLITGYLVALFTPFQIGAGAATMVVLPVLGWRYRHAILAHARVRPARTNLLVWICAYLAFVCLQWITGYGSPHTIGTIVFSMYSVLLTPVCLVIIAIAVGEDDQSPSPFSIVLHLAVVQALVIISYAMVIGRPEMLLAIVNGVLKPVYTAFNLPHPYPWYDPDWNFGSMTIVNYVGVVMTMAAVSLSAKLWKSRRPGYVAAVLVTAFTAFLAENALAVGAAVAALVFSLISVSVLSRIPPGRTGVRAAVRAVLVLAGVIVLLAATYLGSGRYTETHKGKLYRQAMHTAIQQPWRGLVGYGAGGYGSRASYMQLLGDRALMQKGVAVTHCILQWRGCSPGNVPLAADFHRDFVHVYRQEAEWHGSTQGLLISGLIAILMENGLIGSVMLLAMLVLLMRHHGSHGTTREAENPSLSFAAHFGIGFLLCLSVFYNYHEIPTITAVLLLPAVLTRFRHDRS